jgi:DNA transposition AAA+ family ATPase
MIEKFKLYMARTGLNQRQLAWFLGISEEWMSKLMNGHYEAGREVIEAYDRLPGNQEREDIQKIWNILSTENLANIPEEVKILAKKYINPGN